MLKQLREDGFSVTGFERRGRVGGLWSYSEDLSHTTALPRELELNTFAFSMLEGQAALIYSLDRYHGESEQVYLRVQRLSDARE